MSWGSLSQFSPNLQHPMPTMATLSRMASGFIVLSLPDRRALPIVVGRPACFVHLPEGELDRQVELHLLRIHVGHLQIEAGGPPPRGAGGPAGGAGGPRGEAGGEGGGAP